MLESFGQAARMLLRLDPLLVGCVKISLMCSITATAAAAVTGVPAALLLGRRSFPCKRAITVAVQTGMAVPTVVIGLFLYGMLSRSGPLGSLELLYSRSAIILGEFLLAWPMVVALVSSTVAGLDPQAEKTARTLGSGRLGVWWTILREARTGVLAATMAAFGRVVSELGVAMMLGGNIKNHTRTMATALALETQKGEFAVGLALGLVLLAIALVVNVMVQAIRLPS